MNALPSFGSSCHAWLLQRGGEEGNLSKEVRSIPVPEMKKSSARNPPSCRLFSSGTGIGRTSFRKISVLPLVTTLYQMPKYAQPSQTTLYAADIYVHIYRQLEGSRYSLTGWKLIRTRVCARIEVHMYMYIYCALCVSNRPGIAFLPKLPTSWLFWLG